MNETQSQTEPGLTERVDILDSEAARRAGSLEQRSEPRRSLRAECQVFLFHRCDPSTTSFSGVVRNLSFHGVSIVSDVVAPVRLGRPVEVIIESPAEPRIHLAGTVAFCRQVDEACYELGIHVEAAGWGPILMHDIERAQQMYDWFSKSFRLAE